MTRVRKFCLASVAFVCALCLGIAFAACGEKDTEPSYGYGEEGTYYCSASETEDYLLTLGGGAYILSLDAGNGSVGTYGYSEGSITLYEDDEEAGSAYLTEGGISLTWGGRTYLFLSYEYYAVTFTDGGTTIITQSVLNGKAATDPGNAEKEGYVFLGWYADSAFTTRYEFNTAITADTTVYARFVEAGSGAAEYVVTYDYTGDTTETINGVVYNLPTPERSGYTFLGWWVSATNSADELTYKYTDETLCEDTTLFAVFASGSYIGASVKDDGIYWENYNASVTDIILRDEDGNEVDRFNIQSTDQGYAYDFASLPAGKYTLVIQGGGIDETLTYVSNGLRRASGYEVVSGSILMYSAVENAERYYITIECGNPTHDHTMIDNGTSLYYDFSSCDMPAEGITFTVYAYADGYYYSVSSYNYFLGLDAAVVRVEGDAAYWDAVPYAQEYEVYVNGELVATTSSTSYDLSRYPAGDITVAVKPVTRGYWSETGESCVYTKTTLAAPQITGIENYVVSWSEVEGATGYVVRIGDTETAVEAGITSLYLTGDNYAEGLDEYEISVKATAADSADDSPYGDAVTVTGAGVGSTVSYSNGTVTWQYSLNASEYRITVNDGDELVVFGKNSSPVTLTKSGNNEIRIYFVDSDDEIYGTASILVYAYAVVFDARGGTAYLGGEAVDTIYVAKGDTITLPDADYGAVTADFLGWYTLPDMTDDPDATTYQGDGYLFEDGTAFTGNSTMVLYAVWVNPRMVVSLDPAGGTLTDEGGNEVSSTEISLNGRNYTVAVPETGDGAYVFYGWYSGRNGTGTRYTDEMGNAYAPFSDENVTTLYAYWIQVLSFSTVVYNTETVLSVSRGPDIGLVTEVTIPETYTLGGTEYTTRYIGSTAFAYCSKLKVINVPDTVIFMDITNNGYDSSTGIFSGTALEAVNVYATGEPSSTREIIYFSEDGVLFWINTNTGDVELRYYPYGRTDETYSIPETVVNENELELSGRTEVQAIHYVNAVASSAFSGHTELTYMVIPGYITRIGDSTFYGCTSLTGVEFECDLETIPASMFYGCSAIVEFDIPDGVKTIGESAFRDCTRLVTVTMPDSVEVTEAHVFRGCASLENVRLSGSLTTIGDRAFYQCYSLRGIEIPYSVTTIGQYAFCYCTALVSVAIPDSVTSVGTYCFDGCESLASATISSGMTTVPGYCFRNCTSLKTAEIPEGVTLIDDYAFNGCSALNSVTFPSSLTTIGKYVFQNCFSLTEITIPANVSKIDNYAFRYCYKLVEVYDLSSLGISASDTSYTSNGGAGVNALNVYTATDGESRLIDDEDGFRFVINEDGKRYLVGYYGDKTEIVLPETAGGEAYDIYQYAFYGCYDLTAVTIPSTVTEIATYAFYGCSSLVYVEIPDSVTTIGSYAFNGCSSLVSVTLGRGLTSIGSNAFQNCYKLVEIYNLSSLSLTAGSTGNGYVARYAVNIYTTEADSRIVESGDYKFVYDDDTYYLLGYYGSDTDITLPASVNGSGYEILDYAFYGNRTLKSVTIPDSVTAIGQYAFSGCSALINVTIGSGVTAISNYAFYECVTLNNVVIPDTVLSIGLYSFYGCSSLERVVMGDGVTSIGMGAFWGCTGLRVVDFGSGLTSIGTFAFYECNSLESVVIPDGVKSIDTYVFFDCYALESVVLPDGLTTIDGYAFYACTSLSEINIPDAVTTIGEYAFYECYALKSVTIPEGVTEINEGTFYNCTSLAEISVGAGVTAIGRYAFDNTAYYNDESNREGGALYLGTYLLAVDAKTSGSLAVRDGTTVIADYAFYNTSDVTGLTLPDTLVSIGAYCFYKCSMTFLAIPDSVTNISKYAFEYCYYLETVSFGSGLTEIPSSAFYGCTGLKTVVIPDNITSLGSNSFYNCSALESVSFGNGITVISASAFRGCSNLKSLVIPDQITEIGSNSFYSCSSIEYVVIGSSLTSIGSSAFYGCSALTAVYYNGTEAEWSAISIGSSNTALTDAPKYYYSETQPAGEGNFWHWDASGNPVAW